MSEQHSSEVEAGLARLEGYLMSQAALHEADEAGESFAQALSWLGPDEQHVIAERFAQHHLRLKRQILTAVVTRAEELKAEYSLRYAVLRRRLVGLTIAAFAFLATVVALLTAA
ncbi:hypothetical protein ABZ934_23630 [Streptomyces sp. NPDC046557]|uniref:hypothetical protein n=1 Tax=Streptomyces sp. NPDC046557 TaxID=3155372 RepID=UPI0033C4FBF0